jgi:hypothetical protein
MLGRKPQLMRCPNPRNISRSSLYLGNAFVFKADWWERAVETSIKNWQRTFCAEARQ